VHSHPFTKNHSCFLSVLESVISEVLLQQPKQVKVDCRADGLEVPNEITSLTLESGLLCVGLQNVTPWTVYLFGSLKQH
jgi:hypothetical protein